MMGFRLVTHAARARDGAAIRVLLVALLLSLMSLSGMNVVRAVLHSAGRTWPEAPSGLIKSVATHAADSGDQ